MSDFYQDQGAFLVKLMHDSTVPDFVKKAEYETEEGIEALSDHAFADSINRQYPIHTAADVYLSAMYLHGKSASFSEDVAKSIDRAAVVFGIQSEVAEVSKKASLRKTAENAVVDDRVRWDFETKTARFAGVGAEQLKSAADYFIKNYATYDFAERTEIAENLTKQATDMGIELPVEIEKFACLSYVDMDQAAIEFQARALTLHSQVEVGEFLGKIAALQDTTPTPEDSLKLAEFLNGFDVEHNLTRFYGSRMSDPHSAIFNTPIKEHEEKTATVKVGDVVHKIVDLRNHSGDLFEGILGEKVADLRLLANLPPEKARLLNQVLC